MKQSSGRAAFEATLLRTACYFARGAAAREGVAPATTPAQRSERQSLVIGCILTSVAFLEATLNGVWDDLAALNGLPESWFKDRRHLTRIAKAGLPDSLRASLLARYDATLAVTNSPAMDPAASPYQDVQALVMLRNALSHSRPEWEPPEEELPSLRALERRLRGRFRFDTSWKGTHQPFIPHKCLSADCARWAVESVTTFASQFFSHLGLHTITTGAILLTIERCQAGARAV